MQLYTALISKYNKKVCKMESLFVKFLTGEKYGNYRIDIIAAENVSDHAGGAFLSEEELHLSGGKKEPHRLSDLPDPALQYCEIFYDCV